MSFDLKKIILKSKYQIRIGLDFEWIHIGFYTGKSKNN